MKSLRNRVQLIGNVGIDPEIKSFDGGKKMAKFTLATNSFYKDSSGNKVEDTQWHHVVVWGPLSGIAENFIRKGKELAVEGQLVYHSYEDQKGEKRFSTEIIAHDMVLLGAK